MRWFKNLFAVTMATGCVLLAWVVLIEPGQLKFKEYTIHVRGWPQELAGFRIAFITDPHIGSPHITLDKLREIVTRTNDKNPDLTLLGGDYMIQNVVGGTPIPSQEFVPILAELKAKHGVFGVLGNHDWWDDSVRMLRQFDGHQLPMLEDKSVRISVGNSSFWVVGVSDYYEGPHDIAKALSAVDVDEPIIMLTHTPDIFPEVPPHVALTLSGHTHGGQVYVPFLGRPIVPSKYGQRYAMGLVEENGHKLFVSSGIGTSIIPVRFMTPPEVSILMLYPEREVDSKR